MKLTRHDIGGELNSIITKGMYADPKDALREYVQNFLATERERDDCVGKILIKKEKIAIDFYFFSQWKLHNFDEQQKNLKKIF